ncbi:MAG: protein kinase [Chromatiales bacterium]|jgi:eukaryotic-like serine/threonine-protein kinase|nr:protein kinase [Chromatiales bacterium]
MSDEKIGKYAIRGIAGRGAQGIVYAGHDPFVDRAVAIKVWTRDVGDDDESAARMRRLFFNEAQAAGNLDHPNILRVYDAGEAANGQPYIVMEFLKGSRNLRRHCNFNDLLPIEAVVEYVRDCALALDHAHSNGVIHRDIKPANIMLTTQNDIKIVDFGIADRQRPDATRVGNSYGSPRYMSPEQARGDDLNTQTDLYSLGAVLFELLAGRPTFQKKGVPALLYHIAYEQPPTVQSLRPEVSEELNAVVLRALEKDIGMRYQTGGEMAADLDAVLNGEAPEELGEPGEDELFDTVRGLSFLKPFTDDEVHEFVDAGEWLRFRLGQEIVAEDDERESLFLMLSGRACSSRGGAVLDEIDEGECFGEISYITGEAQVYAVNATKPSMVLRIDEPVVDWASFTCQLKLHKQLQRVLAERLSVMSRRVTEAR